MKPTTPQHKKTTRRSALVLFAFIAVIVFSCFVFPTTVWQMLLPHAQAATFTVTNTNDSGAGSLRQAIAAAGATSATPDTISFNIPPSDPRHFYYVNNGIAGTVSRSMISVTAASSDPNIADIDPDWPHSWYSIETAGFVAGPLFSNPVTIDGFSQPGSMQNTNPSGPLNSVLKIEVTNSGPSCSRIFHIAFAPVVISGMVLNGCSGSTENKLIDVDFAAHDSIATGNYLGTDSSGTIGLGSGYGVQATQANGVRVGGNSPADRNLVSANVRAVVISSGSSSGALVEQASIIGNLIGTARDSVSPLGNGFSAEIPGLREDAISISSVAGLARNNRIENNVIAFNARFGVSLQGGGVGTGQSVFRNPILNNSIHSNGDIGINLPSLSEVGNAVSPNDPCDVDDGMNGGQNFPVIKSAVISGNTVSIVGTLNSIGGAAYDLEFFANAAADATFFGEGQTVLGRNSVNIPAGSCVGNFFATLPLPVGAGNVITATATDANGNTSEFSAVYIAEAQSDSCTLPPNGLVSWYSAEGNVSDSQGENHGRFLQVPPRYTTGKIGRAFELGTRSNIDTVTMPDDTSLDFTNAFTIEMWVAPGEAGLATGQTFFISKGDLNQVGTQSYGIMFTPDRKVVNRVGNGMALDQLASASAIPLDQFTHIASTYDGTTLRVYVNGSLNGSQATSIGTLLDTSDPLVIGGARFFGGFLSAKATVDKVSLYNRALSDAEIASVFAAGTIGKCKPRPPVTRTWDGGGATNNWSEGANWSGDAIPTAADLVVFDGTSIKNSNIDVDFSTSTLQIAAAYTGTISQGASNLVVNGNFTQSGGTFIGGSGAMSVTSTLSINGGSFTAPAGTLDCQSNVSISASSAFNPNGGTVAFTGGGPFQNLSIPPSLTLNNIVVNRANNTDILFVNSASTLIAAGNLSLIDGRLQQNSVESVNVEGNVTVASTFDGGQITNFRFTGSANQTFTNLGGVNVPATWEINKPAGTVTAATDLVIPGRTLNITSGRLFLNDGADLTTGPLNLGTNGKLVNDSSTTITVGGNVSNSGIIDLNGGGPSCPGTDSILIRSSDATQRSWTGARNRLVDVDVQNMGGTGTKTVYSGTNSGGNNTTWIFDSICPPDISITPSVAGVPAGEAQIFTASGGFQPYTFSIQVNNSGATIDATGRYTAGSTTGASDTVRVTDAFGASADATVNIVGLPTKLGFIVQPSNASTGQSITPAVKVAAQDANGNTVTTINPFITVSIANNPSGGTLSGTVTRQASFGVATFDNLSIDAAGMGYTLLATNVGLISGTSSSFTVSAGTAAKVAFIVEPSDVGVGSAISPPVKVAIQDAAGNTVITATNSITVAIGNNPGSGAISGTLTKSAVAGVATFSNLSIDTVGAGYTLVATSSGLVGGTSAAFNVVNGLVVTNTNDSGLGSLRGAIIAANSNPGFDFIRFNIPGTGPFLIEVGTSLPTITERVSINAATQPGFNDAPIVELRGTFGSGNAFRIEAPGASFIRGFAINGFGTAIAILNGENTGLFQNYIGLDITGEVARPNLTGVLVSLSAVNTQIGPSTELSSPLRNVISGNTSAITLLRTGNIVEHNYIGTNATGSSAVPNFYGVRIFANGNTVRENVISGNQQFGVFAGPLTVSSTDVTDALIERNRIGLAANTLTSIPNGQHGVRIPSSRTRGVRLTQNRIFGNNDFGIRLGTIAINAPPLPNDPQDPDDGANGLQNYPVITSAFTQSGTTPILGSLNSTPSSTFQLEFFSSPTCDASGNGEGETFIGSATVTTGASGIASLASPAVSLPTVVATGRFITATATDAAGNTSEFSKCAVVGSRSGIAGTVLASNGTPIANAQVRLTNPQGPTFSATTATNSTGNFAFSFLPPADYTLTVIDSNRTFTPATRFYPNLSTDQTNQNFIAGAPQTFILRGTTRTNAAGSTAPGAKGGQAALPPIPAGGFPLLGATFSLSGPGVNRNVTNDSFGNYRFDALPPGNYVLTPSKPNYVFNPPVANVNIGSNETVDFEGTSLGLSTLSGRIVYDSLGGINSMNADGSGLVTLSTNSLRSASRIMPRLSENGQRIAFVSRSTTNTENRIVTIGADGTARDFVLTQNSRLFSPVHSPDGTRIAFHDDSESLFVMNVDGSNAVSIVGGCAEPDWSPDGTQIVCVEEVGSTTDRVKTVNLETRAQSTLDSTSGRKFSPRWSPDGTRIAFIRRQSGAPATHSIIVKTLLGGTDTFMSGTNSLNQSLSWSPDSARLLFIRDSVSAVGNALPPGGNNQLVTIQSSDGQNLLVIVDAFDGERIDWGTSNSFATPASPTPSVIQSGAVSISFPSTTGTGGFTTITPIEPNSAGSAPSGFVIGNFAFEINTTAGFTPPVTICVDLDDPGVQSRALRAPGRPALMHSENGVLVDITTSYDEQTGILCGQTNSFSPFVVAEQIDPALPSIHGLVLDSNGDPMAGVFVGLTGDDTATTKTNSDGLFSFVNLAPGGDYNVQPQKVGNIFAEYSIDFPGLTDETVVVFTGQQADFAISGQVVDGAGVPVEGQPIALDGAVTIETVTGAMGNYSFAGLPADGSYSVAPASSTSSFSPLQHVVSALTSDVSGADFAVFAPTAASVSVGGRVLTAEGRGLSGAQLSLMDSEGNIRVARTNGFGFYRFEDVQAGSIYFLNVEAKQYQFENSPRVINVLDELTGVDFTALPTPD